MTLPRRVNLVLTLRQLLKRRYAGFAVQRSAARSPKSTQKRKSPQPPSVQKIDFNFKPIPLVPESLHRQLFSADYPSTSAETVAQDETIEKLIFPDGLEGRNLLEKLEFKCAEYVQEYQDILSSIGELEELPPTPKKWNWKSGWTKYDADGTFVEVPCPDGKALFFDIEVCMNDGLLPTLAVAVSESAWFSWCSERLVNKAEIPEFARLEHLIPLDMEDGAMEKRVIIGHNVAYDRARVREQYLTKKSNTKFWDTMSMSIPMFGMADHQVALYEKKNDLEDEFEKGSGWVSAWKDRVSKNSLAAVHEKLCGGTSDLKMDKSLRDTFVKGDIEDVRHNFQALTTYCASDVKATFEIYKVMLPEFKKRMPSPITWFGMFEMGSAYLPINKNWRDFYIRCEASCAEKNNEAARKVIRASREVLKSLKKAEGYKKDPWMWAVDWNIPAKNTLPRWYQNLFDSKAIQKEDLQMIMATNVKTKSREFPRIFGLCYGPYPLLFKRDYGWGFLVPPPGADDGFLTIEAVELYSRRKEYCSMPVGKIFELILNNSNTHPDVKVGKAVSHCGPFEFHQLPHPGGAGKNVGNPFVKDYADMFKDRILWAYRHEGAMVQLLEDQSATRYWGNYRERFKEQLTVWLDDEATKGAICPTVVPAGTVTRRGVHKLFLTASNPKKGMIGTEIKSMIQCYDDKVFVGADVDSQEQWIAALLGDSASGRGRAGATPFANMLLVGSKSDNSDLHSVVAQQVGISRNNAKVLNYARLYGSGIQHAVDFLKKEGIAVKKAQELSNKLFTTTKGQQITYAELLPVAVKYFQKFLNEAETDFSEDFVVLNDRYFLPDKCPLGSNVTTEFEDWLVEWMQKKKASISASDIIPHIYVKDKVKLFSGGFETHTFNYLEMMLRSNELRTPVLGCRLSQCLEPLPAEVADSEDFRNKYRRSIINWVVQSSAVDFLHMLLLCMHWFIEKYAIDARYSISIHDEVRYMVSEKDKYRCALALHLSNAYVRAAISQHLGIEELPMSIAFFSQVDIDKVLRKEVTIAVKNPDGQLIPEGEALNFKEVFEKTQGSLEA
ncbi:hypothetical protein L596_017731 [Steinernema carpocapsae]|uniref:DNA-directed DNA polymerase n=1 Tax=Steinernema carpocapsae TaxID=34508 RepID=A0A4U5N2H7_STECR|nr:hypothetical protein L596_017731 [Steinernema carpocapsae]